MSYGWLRIYACRPAPLHPWRPAMLVYVLLSWQRQFQLESVEGAKKDPCPDATDEGRGQLQGALLLTTTALSVSLHSDFSTVCSSTGPSLPTPAAQEPIKPAWGGRQFRAFSGSLTDHEVAIWRVIYAAQILQQLLGLSTLSTCGYIPESPARMHGALQCS